MNNYKKFGTRWIFTEQVYNEICATIGTRPVEQGGILGSDDNRHITHYYFDKSSNRRETSYTMDVDTLNKVIEQWNDSGVRFVGVIHSHPNGMIFPSRPDEELAAKIIESMDVDGELFTPIVQVNPSLNGDIRIYPYVFRRFVKRNNEKFVIKKNHSNPENERVGNLEKRVSDSFSRIERVFPYGVMRKKAVICIGCGGSRGFLETLARNGVSTFFLYDKDKVEETNIATQGAFRSEVGRHKVDVIKESILDINPLANVYAIPKFLDDDVTDEEFAITTKLRQYNREDVILCGCTDDAKAQIRCELLSRKYNIPYLAAQVYPGGKGHEVVFTYPGLTKACSMCMLGTRYKDIFSKEKSTGGSSAGTSVWVTDHLNCVKTYLALCILCYDEHNTLYYKTLNKYADNNYFMSKCSEKFGAEAFDPFAEVSQKEKDLHLALGTVAIEQTAEEDCECCLVTKNTDTRKFLKELIFRFGNN